ncbi:unnamed protein product [Amoebophrya sp. A120]|nr:unnamed protein product [Amoebophrya sp. A120]|eukprot:GSA120T00008810001.1
MISRELRDLLVKCAPHWSAKNIFQASRKLVRLGITERSHLACYLGGSNEDSKKSRINRDLEKLGEKGLSKKTLNALKAELEGLGIGAFGGQKKSFTNKNPPTVAPGLNAAQGGGGGERFQGSVSLPGTTTLPPGATSASANQVQDSSIRDAVEHNKPLRLPVIKTRFDEIIEAAPIPPSYLAESLKNEQIGGSSSSSTPAADKTRLQQLENRKRAATENFIANKRKLIVQNSLRNQNASRGGGANSYNNSLQLSINQLHEQQQLSTDAALGAGGNNASSISPRSPSRGAARRHIREDLPKQPQNVFQTYQDESEMPKDALSILTVVKQGEKALENLLKHAKHTQITTIEGKQKHDFRKRKMQPLSPEEKLEQDVEIYKGLDPLKYHIDSKEEENDYSDDFESEEQSPDGAAVGSSPPSRRKKKKSSRPQSSKSIPRTPSSLRTGTRPDSSASSGKKSYAVYHHRSPTGIEPAHSGPRPAGIGADFMDGGGNKLHSGGNRGNANANKIGGVAVVPGSPTTLSPAAAAVPPNHPYPPDPNKHQETSKQIRGAYLRTRNKSGSGPGGSQGQLLPLPTHVDQHQTRDAGGGIKPTASQSDRNIKLDLQPPPIPDEDLHPHYQKRGQVESSAEVLDRRKTEKYRKWMKQYL